MSDFILPSEQARMAAIPKAALNKGTVNAFLVVASSKLTQYDERLQRTQPNIYRLGHYFGALEKVESDVSDVLNEDSPEALARLKASLLRRFTSRGGQSDLTPIRNVIRQIDAFLEGGKLPSLTRRASTAKKASRFRLPGKAPGSTVEFGIDRLFGRFFQFWPTNDEPTVDEDRLSQAEIVALLREYGKPSMDLRKAVDAFILDLDPGANGLRMASHHPKTARFPEGPKGEKAWQAWFKKQPKDFQDEWKKENALNRDQFKEGGEGPTEEGMMEKFDEAEALPVEVELRRVAEQKKKAAREKAAASLSVEDLYELDPKGELDDDGLAKLHSVLMRESNPERALQKADRMLRTHGVEAVNLDEEDYGADPYASYLNTGDLYNVTLAWIYPESRWVVTTAADLRQAAERGGRFASREAASGLYGFTKQTQRDVEATVRKARRQARKLAREIYLRDEGAIPFLKIHAKRAKSTPAKLLLAAMDDIGSRKASERVAMSEGQERLYDNLMTLARGLDANDANLAVHNAWTMHSKEAVDARRVDFRSIKAKLVGDLEATRRLASESPSREAGDKIARGMYGYPTKTARLCLNACSEFRAFVGEVSYDLHSRRTARHDRITGFLSEHSKTAKCSYSRVILGCYPDAPVSKEAGCEKLPEGPMRDNCEKKSDEKEDKKAGKLPDALKEHQFTSEDNPNPKGNDRDGDGKTNEKKPFKEAAKKPEVGDEVRVSIFGRDREGVVKKIHSAGDMADVDFGKGDVYGIAFGRIKPQKQASEETPSPTRLASAWGRTLSADFDPNLIGKNESGALIYESDESHTGENFTEQENTELSDKQESGSISDANEPVKTAGSRKLIEKAKELQGKLDKRNRDHGPAFLALKSELENIRVSDDSTTQRRLENAVQRAEKALERSGKTAGFGFAHRFLMDFKDAVEDGESKKTLEDLYAKASQAVSSLSSSKATRAYDFLDKWKAKAEKGGIKIASTPDDSVQGWIEWEE